MAIRQARTREQRISKALEDKFMEECDICHRTYSLSRGGYEKHRVHCEWSRMKEAELNVRPTSRLSKPAFGESINAIIPSTYHKYYLIFS